MAFPFILFFLFVLNWSYVCGFELRQDIMTVSLKDLCNKCNETYLAKILIFYDSSQVYEDDRYIDIQFVGGVEFTSDRFELIYLMTSDQAKNLTYGVDYIKNSTSKIITIYNVLSYGLSFMIKNLYMHATYDDTQYLFSRSYKNRNAITPLENFTLKFYLFGEHLSEGNILFFFIIQNF